MHISVLFPYKQMVVPAIKAPLFRRILMRISAVLPGFFNSAVKKYRILIRFLYFEGQIFAYFRHFFSYKQMVFAAIKAPLLRRILMRLLHFSQVFYFALKENRLFAHDEVNVHCSPAKKVFFPH